MYVQVHKRFEILSQIAVKKKSQIDASLSNLEAFLGEIIGKMIRDDVLNALRKQRNIDKNVKFLN